MDKNELTALRAEYLSKNKETIDYILKDLDNVLKTKVLSGSTEVVITRDDVYKCLSRYKDFKAMQTKVAYNDLFYKFGIAINYEDVLRRYKAKLKSNGITVTSHLVTDLNFTYNGKGSLSDLINEMIRSREVMYLIITVDTEKELI